MSRTDAEELLADIGIGLDVEAFLSGAAGKRLLLRIDEQTAQAIDKLVEADAEDPAAIRDLQNKVKWGRGFKSGLMELVQEGENAEGQLRTPGEGEETD